MNNKNSQFKASQFATIERSGSVSVKLNEFFRSQEGRSQLNHMKLVRNIAEKSNSTTNSGGDKK